MQSKLVLSEAESVGSSETRKAFLEKRVLILIRYVHGKKINIKIWKNI